MEKISVIIPVYNTEKYLIKCLNSVVNQTYKNLQIIIIDDGSTDNSGKICDEFAKKDDRIIVIHKENEGVSTARNLGLKKATGAYIMFVDSDDFIRENMVERMYQSLMEYNVDMVYCNCSGNKKNLEIVSSEEMFKIIIKNGYVWNKIYKTDIIKENNILFDTKKYIFEDFLFNAQYIEKISKILYLNEKIYCYERNVESVMNSKFSYKWMSLIDAYDEAEKIYKNKKCYHYFKAIYVLNNARIKQKMYLEYDEKNEEFITRCNDNIKKYIKDVLHSNINLKLKVKVFIYTYFYGLICMIKKARMIINSRRLK